MIFYMKLSQTVSYIEKREIMKAETKSPLKKNGAADSKLSGRIWFNICLFGFTGQMAWTLENMYFNTFLYNTVYEGGKVTGSLSSMTAIKLMVAFSAATAVITTFIMGNLSDRVNKRKNIYFSRLHNLGYYNRSIRFYNKRQHRQPVRHLRFL